MDTILYPRCSTRHPDRQYTIQERARGRPDRPGQIRLDQTGPDRQTYFGHAHVCFVRGKSGRETLAPLSSSSGSNALVTSGALCLCV